MHNAAMHSLIPELCVVCTAALLTYDRGQVEYDSSDYCLSPRACRIFAIIEFGRANRVQGALDTAKMTAVKYRIGSIVKSTASSRKRRSGKVSVRCLCVSVLSSDGDEHRVDLPMAREEDTHPAAGLECVTDHNLRQRQSPNPRRASRPAR